MKANELRIGNWIYVRTNGNFEQVTHIYENFGMFIDPIELTKEWLLKFGFKQASDGTWFKEDTPFHRQWKIQFYKRPEERYLVVSNTVYYKNSDMILCPLIYVHQLQNLFYVLTGNELKSTA